MYNHSKTTHIKIKQQKALASKKLILELDWPMNSWNRKIMTKGTLTVLIFFWNITTIDFFTSICWIFAGNHRKQAIGLLHMCWKYVWWLCSFSKKSLLCHIICVLLKICSGPSKKIFFC
jgi:hypothetical protein